MSPEEQIQAIAAALHEVITETDESVLDQNPESGFANMACRFIVALGSLGLSVSSTTRTVQDRLQAGHAAAALRTLDTLTAWLASGLDHSYMVAGKVEGVEQPHEIEVYAHEGDHLKAFFTGQSVQDACAQFAAVLLLNEGSIDEPVEIENAPASEGKPV